MAFPTLIVILFFATLNFNPKVLYAPSDFRNEENFLNTLVGTQKLSLSLDQVSEELEKAKTQILEQATAQISAVGGSERKRLTELISQELGQIQSQVRIARAEAAAVVADAEEHPFPHSTVQALALQALSDGQSHSLPYISRRTGVGGSATRRALERMISRGLIELSEDLSGDELFTLRTTRL